MPFVSPWQRASKSRPCPICGDAGPLCLVVPGTATICPNVPSERLIEGVGYAHPRDPDKPFPSLRGVRAVQTPPAKKKRPTRRWRPKRTRT